jgi:hypothetical protein
MKILQNYHNPPEEIKIILDKYYFYFDYGIDFFRKDYVCGDHDVLIIYDNGKFKLECWNYLWNEEEGDVSTHYSFYSNDGETLQEFFNNILYKYY